MRQGVCAGVGGLQRERRQVQAHNRKIAAVVGVARDPGGDMVTTDQPQPHPVSVATRQQPRNPLPGRGLHLLPPLPRFLDLSSLAARSMRGSIARGR